MQLMPIIYSSCKLIWTGVYLPNEKYTCRPVLNLAAISFTSGNTILGGILIYLQYLPVV